MTDAPVIPRGQQITLLNGQSFKLIFSLYTIAVLEDELGSIDKLGEVFGAQENSGETDGDNAKPDRKVIRIIGGMIANSLFDAQGTPVHIAVDDLLRLIALEDLKTVMESVQAQLIEAFPKDETTTPAVDTAAISQTIAATTGVSLGAHSNISGSQPVTSHSATPQPARVFGG